MSFQTDAIFIRALRSNAELTAMLPAGDVYNTSIPVPDEELDNAPIPYIIVSFDGLQNEEGTKDSIYESSTDRVQIGIEVVAKTRPNLCTLTEAIRKTVREFFWNLSDSDEDYGLVPIDYTFTAQQVIYDPDKEAFGQVLTYQCEVNA